MCYLILLLNALNAEEPMRHEAIKQENILPNGMTGLPPNKLDDTIAFFNAGGHYKGVRQCKNIEGVNE